MMLRMVPSWIAPRLPRSHRLRRLAGAVVLFSTTLFALLALFDDETTGGVGPRRALLAVDDAAGGSRGHLALVRPFGPRDGDADALLRSFDLWDTRWPCTGTAAPPYEVDLVLSYSRRLDGEGENLPATRVVEAIRSRFFGEDRALGWVACFSDLKVIEANLDPATDIYQRGPTGVPERMDWVSGPNGQFRTTMSELMALGTKDEPYYELALIMEPDNHPQRPGWLDELLAEAVERAPFAVLGSKYRGRAWDGIKDQMPASLVEHINGNAAYNLTHPLFQRVLRELRMEANTPFVGIPYDYRISQMAHEALHGTPPEFPFPWIRDGDGSPVQLPKKVEIEAWWKNFRGGEDEDEAPLKESRLIGNFAESNYLMKHVGDEALVHGLNVYQPLNPYTHKISLVVSAWDDRRDHQSLLSEVDNSEHPFQEIVVMENPRNDVLLAAWHTLDDDKRGSWIEFQRDHIDRVHAPLPEVRSAPVQVKERDIATDVTDVCDAPVSTEWFYHTNAYHKVAERVDLMFTGEVPVSRPLVPYTPAESLHCDQYPACRATLRIAREIYPELDKVVLDMDVPYHAPSRDAFCKYWREMYGQRGEHLEEREGGRKLARMNGVPLAPTATAYVAYLYRTGLAENIYSFTNVLVHGTTPLFVRVTEDPLMDNMDPESSILRGTERKLFRGRNRFRDQRNSFKRRDNCAAAGERSKECGASGISPKTCCATYTSTCDGKTCQEVPDYSGSRTRKLSISDPGILVEG